MFWCKYDSTAVMCFLFLIIELLPVCSLYICTLPAVKCGWSRLKPDFGYISTWATTQKKKKKNQGCIPSRWGKSPRGIVIATSSSQWIQTATNYFKPQEENLLHENDISHHIPMSWHTCSLVYTCQVMHRETTVTFYAKSLLSSVSYLLDAFLLLLGILE